MTTSGADSPAGTVALDWDELAGLDRIAAVYTLGEHAVVLETTDGREIRITALYDRAKGKYVAEFEPGTGTVNVVGSRIFFTDGSPHTITNTASSRKGDQACRTCREEWL